MSKYKVLFRYFTEKLSYKAKHIVCNTFLGSLKMWLQNGGFYCETCCNVLQTQYYNKEMFFLNCVSLSLFVFFHFACLCVRLAYLSTKVCVNTIGLPLYVTNWSMFKETSQELPNIWSSTNYSTVWRSNNNNNNNNNSMVHWLFWI